MKELPLFLFLIFTFYGFKNSNDTYKKRVQDRPTIQAIDLGEWEVSDPKAMIDYYTACSGPKCKAHAEFVINRRVLNKIKRTFPIDKAEWVAARYTTTDIDRYRRNRGIENGNGKGEVEGYTTLLYKITYETKREGEQAFATVVRYYDVGTICPPPSGSCD